MIFPSITAHTGCEGTAYNTLQSAIVGISSGADFVEVDVRATIDGTAVLSHNDALLASDDETVQISKTPYSELSRKLPSLQRLGPLFDEVLTRGAKINLDLKDDECLEPVVELVGSRGAHDRAVITGCDSVRAAKIKRLDPSLSVFLNTSIPVAAGLPVQHNARAG